jgi:hypothetical protein
MLLRRLSVFFCSFAFTLSAYGGDAEPLIEKIAQVAREGQGAPQARAAWKSLVQQGPSALLPTLNALHAAQVAQPEAANWLRSAVDAIAERELASGRPLPVSELERFVRNRASEPRVRRLAYEWLCRADRTAPDRLLNGMLQDPSVELRRDAVAVVMNDARANLELGDQSAARATYQVALDAARDRDQVDEIAKQLKGLGVTVDLATHFGFIKTWQVIGPFDSSGGKGYAALHPPEMGVNLAARHKGKANAELAWKAHTSTHAYAQVDFNKAIGKHMGCAGFAFAAFDVEKEQPAELRVESNNAIKVFCNGQLVYAHEEYHHGHRMDQYVAKVVLKAGRNEILVKVCQNEQKEEWAQQWAFHLRVCDSVGTAIKPRQ